MTFYLPQLVAICRVFTITKNRFKIPQVSMGDFFLPLNPDMINKMWSMNSKC
jgi:hypothetical protein